MIKNILLVLVFSVFTGTFVKAQIKQHCQWKLSTKKINDCEYDLIFTVTLDKGWHTYSVLKIKGAEKDVFPTAITFTTDKGYSLIGNLTETKPTPLYDETIKKTVLLHYKKAVITQRIKLNSGAKVKITGTYENQVCDDHSCDTPPYEEFYFDLQGTATCK